MIDPELYNRTNLFQRRDAECFLKENIQIFKKLNNGSKTIDVGCGEGFVMVEILGKLISGNDSELLGADICEDMLEFARKKYGKAGCAFRKVNIDEDLDDDLKGKFDLVTSFYCIQLVKDFQRTMENIYDLMNSGGTCILLYPIEHTMIEVFKSTRRDPKWEKYSKGETLHAPKLYNITEDEMSKIGFKGVNLAVQTKEFEFTDMNVFKDLCLSAITFRTKMTEQEIEILFNDMIERYKSSLNCKFTYDDAGNLKTIKIKYKIIGITASK